MKKHIMDSLYAFIDRVDLIINKRSRVIQHEKGRKISLSYDRVIQPPQDYKIQYGIIDGNSTILLIKGGQGADIVGYNEKYMKLAFDMNRKYGCTVITASNKEFNGSDSLGPTMRMIEEYCCEERKFSDYQVFYMGVSNGALLGSWYSFKYPEIKRLLLINTPIKARNYYYVIGGLEASKAEKITLVYGKKDFSYPYVSLINPLFLKENIHYKEVEEADHHFTGKLDIFTALPEKYLF